MDERIFLFSAIDFQKYTVIQGIIFLNHISYTGKILNKNPLFIDTLCQKNATVQICQINLSIKLKGKDLRRLSKRVIKDLPYKELLRLPRDIAEFVSRGLPVILEEIGASTDVNLETLFTRSLQASNELRWGPKYGESPVIYHADSTDTIDIHDFEPSELIFAAWLKSIRKMNLLTIFCVNFMNQDVIISDGAIRVLSSRRPEDQKLREGLYRLDRTSLDDSNLFPQLPVISEEK